MEVAGDVYLEENILPSAFFAGSFCAFFRMAAATVV
jgi:hypothetical protein